MALWPYGLMALWPLLLIGCSHVKQGNRFPSDLGLSNLDTAQVVVFYKDRDSSNIIVKECKPYTVIDLNVQKKNCTVNTKGISHTISLEKFVKILKLGLEKSDIEKYDEKTREELLKYRKYAKFLLDGRDLRDLERKKRILEAGLKEKNQFIETHNIEISKRPTVKKDLEDAATMLDKINKDLEALKLGQKTGDFFHKKLARLIQGISSSQEKLSVHVFSGRKTNFTSNILEYYLNNYNQIDGIENSFSTIFGKCISKAKNFKDKVIRKNKFFNCFEKFAHFLTFDQCWSLGRRASTYGEGLDASALCVESLKGLVKFEGCLGTARYLTPWNQDRIRNNCVNSFKETITFKECLSNAQDFQEEGLSGKIQMRRACFDSFIPRITFKECLLNAYQELPQTERVGMGKLCFENFKNTIKPSECLNAADQLTREQNRFEVTETCHLLPKN